MPALVTESGTVLAADARLLTSFWGRLVGAIPWRALPPGVALGIAHCNQVHSFGLTAPLTLLFCDPDGIVLHAQTLAPNRISARIARAVTVWELAPGATAALGTRLVLTETST